MQDQALRDLYQAVVLDHARSPRNQRRPEPCTHEAMGDNPLCGDRVTVFLRVGDGGEIEDAGFAAQGCAIALASASLMTEAVRGRSAAAVRDLEAAIEAMCRGDKADDEPAAGADAGAVAEIGEDEALAPLRALGGVRAFPMRVKCVTLPWQTLLAALDRAGTTSTE